MAKEIVCDSCAVNLSRDLSRKLRAHPRIAKFLKLDPKTFNVCPFCGAFMPWTRRIVCKYLALSSIARILPNASRLLAKSEVVAAVREATIALEELVRQKSRLKARGADLMDRAFRFEYDRATNRIHMPGIKLNNLRTEAKRNEQDGIRLLAMGLMRGVRNIFAHSRGTTALFYSLHTVAMVALIYHQIEGSEGTIAEDRTIFKPMIPKEHRGHIYQELYDKRHNRTAHFYCKDCAQHFSARLRLVIRN